LRNATAPGVRGRQAATDGEKGRAGGFEDEDLEKERKSVRGRGIIATRRGDRADARDWTRNIIVFGYLPREKQRASKRERERERERDREKVEAVVRRRLDGGKGHLIEAGSLQGRNVWIPRWFQVAGRQAGGRGGFAGAGSPPVPRGVPRLPRPAIIRLSGATISVNVPDPELEGQLEEPTGSRGVCRARARGIEQHRHRPVEQRNIVTPPPDPATEGVFGAL